MKSYLEELEVLCMVGNKYRHYKGNSYKVIGCATHSESLELLVLYKDDINPKIWARPYKMWNDIIDSKGTKRFTLIEKEN